MKPDPITLAVLNTLLIGAMTMKLGMHHLLSQVIATGLILCWNFVLNKIWTFNE